MPATYRHPEAIATSAWLAEHLGDPHLRIFECTVYLDPPTPGVDAPYTVRSGRADYEAGHVPGAGFLDLQAEISDASSPSWLRFTMPSPEALAEALGRRGVGDDTRVVLYSRGTLQWSTRVWWMLRAIGFDAAAVLDGGFATWVREGRPVSTEPCTYPAARLTPRPRPELIVGRDTVRAAIGDARVCTINALAPDLHRGENPRYGRPGRVPGSVNVPAISLFDPDTLLLVAPERAAAAFREAGASCAERTICYCGGGIAATLDAFLLHQLGYEHVAVYDASMSEWARDPELPIETG